MGPHSGPDLPSCRHVTCSAIELKRDTAFQGTAVAVPFRQHFRNCPQGLLGRTWDDRVQSDRMPLTDEFLAQMLGAPRTTDHGDPGLGNAPQRWPHLSLGQLSALMSGCAKLSHLAGCCR